jgi:mannosyltransferase
VNRRLRNPDLIPIAIAGAVGLLLAAIDLGARSLWFDEGSTYAIVSQSGAALRHGIADDGGNMLLYYVVMHVVVAWFGDAVWVMRAPSVLANGCTGALVAAVALRLFPGNRRLAAAAGLLAVVSLPLIYWGQNVRGYAWLVSFSVASFLALLAILQTPAERSPSHAALSAYVLSTLAALYIGYDVALLIPAQLVLLLVHRERARLVIGCLVVVGLLSIPLLVLAAQRGSGQLFWVTPLDWQVAGQAVLALFSAAFLPNFHRTATTVPAVIVMGLAVIAGLGLAGRAVWRARDAQSWPQLFILAWMLVPALLTLIAYAAGEPIELTRVTILELPALGLLVAWLLLRPETQPLLGVGAVAVLLALRLLQVIPAYGASPEPWKTVTAYVLKATPAHGTTCVAFYAQDGREAFDYYLLHTTRLRSGPFPNLRPVLPTLPWGSVRSYVEGYATLNTGQRARIAAKCPRLWLITSHSGQSGGTHQSLVNLERYQALASALERLYPHHNLRTFGWASPIRVRLYSS